MESVPKQWVNGSEDVIVGMMQDMTVRSQWLEGRKEGKKKRSVRLCSLSSLLFLIRVEEKETRHSQTTACSRVSQNGNPLLLSVFSLLHRRNATLAFFYFTTIAAVADHLLLPPPSPSSSSSFSYTQRRTILSLFQSTPSLFPTTEQRVSRRMRQDCTLLPF